MKKVLVCAALIALASTTFACSKDKGETNTAASAAPVAESLAQVEVKYQRNDAAATDPNTALTCKYMLVSGANGNYTVAKAEVKTSGKCDFDGLRAKASVGGSLSAAQAANIVAAVTSDSNLPASAKDSWDCTSYNVKTNINKVGVQDCKNGKGNGDAVAKNLTSILGL